MASLNQELPPAPLNPGQPLPKPRPSFAPPPTASASVEAALHPPPDVPLAGVAAPAAARPETQTFEVAELSIDRIDVNPDNSGGDGSRGDIEGLADNIEQLGQLQYIRVRPGFVPDRFIVVHGHRRLLAKKKRGAKTIMAEIDRRPYDPVRSLREEIAENLHREGIPAVNLARVLKRLQEQARYTLEQLAAATSTNLGFVGRKLSLLRFSPDTQDKIAQAASDEIVFQEIAKLSDSAAREALAARAIKERLTQEQAIRLVEAHRPKRRCRRPGKKPLQRLTLPLGAEGKGGVLTLAAADGMAELTAETIRDALEFALQEIRAGLKKGVAAAELPAWLAQRTHKARPAGGAAGERANAPQPSETSGLTP
jgi:ParB/RepB/Spo0J family partition protein